MLGDEWRLQARGNTGQARVERSRQGWNEKSGRLDREDQGRVGRDCLICSYLVCVVGLIVAVCIFIVLGLIKAVCIHIVDFVTDLITGNHCKMGSA
jgi:hypothetical protein